MRSLRVHASVITSKAAIDYHFKTNGGRRELNSSTLPASGQASLINSPNAYPALRIEVEFLLRPYMKS